MHSMCDEHFQICIPISHFSFPVPLFQINRTSAAIIYKAITRGKKWYVHCFHLIDNGVGRSLLATHEFLFVIMNTYHELCAKILNS